MTSKYKRRQRGRKTGGWLVARWLVGWCKGRWVDGIRWMDGKTDELVELLNELLEWMIVNQSIGRLTDWLTDWPTDQLTDSLVLTEAGLPDGHSSLAWLLWSWEVSGDIGYFTSLTVLELPYASEMDETGYSCGGYLIHHREYYRGEHQCHGQRLASLMWHGGRLVIELGL